MELLQLRYFCVVAKHQNMTKAAAELMISQPALSKTIAALEKELGTPLFVRRNRSIFPEPGRRDTVSENRPEHQSD